MRFRCHGCGEVVDAASALPFRCPRAVSGDDVDHVLVAELPACAFPSGDEPNPFLRYRTLLSPYRFAREVGLSDAAWGDLVEELDTRLMTVDGRGFRVTPMTEQKSLAALLGRNHSLWVKDETNNVSGSHKVRHLALVMIYLRVLEIARQPAARGLRKRRLAIASCGNAALAAAVIARAADWPLDVFIPVDADAVVKEALQDHGAQITICERRDGDAGDPCVLHFREAVAQGAIPFSVQGPENGLAIEGGRTLAFEMAEVFAGAGVPDVVFVQVGGGALASAVAQGLALAHAGGVIAKVPNLIAVQTAGCAPLARAWQRLDNLDLAEAARHRSRFMWGWETQPESLASGILDDETYDWWAVVEGMRASGGWPVIVDEDAVRQARDLAWHQTGIKASATGTAGLAGLLSQRNNEGATAVIFSGVDR